MNRKEAGLLFLECERNKHNKKKSRSHRGNNRYYFGAKAFYGLIIQPTYNHIRPHTSALNLMQSYFCKNTLLTIFWIIHGFKFSLMYKNYLVCFCIYLVFFASNSNKVMHLKISHFIIVISSSDSPTSMTSFLILFIFFISLIVGRMLLLLLFGTCQFQEIFLIVLIAKNWT